MAYYKITYLYGIKQRGRKKQIDQLIVKKSKTYTTYSMIVVYKNTPLCKRNHPRILTLTTQFSIKIQIERLFDSSVSGFTDVVKCKGGPDKEV